MGANLSQAQIIDALRAALGLAQGTKAPGSSWATPGPMAPSGFFGMVGLDQSVLSLHITGRGLLEKLPVFADVLTQPQFAYITGIQETAGQTEPSTECSTCLSGETLGCIQTAQFGYLCRETKTLDPSKAIERINAGELDLRLLNDVVPNLGGLTAGTNIDRGTALQVATAWAMFEVGVLFNQKLVPMLWTGNPANDIGTGYKEFPGLNILISTGKVDANKGTTCPALDSDVKDFGYSDVSAVTAANAYKIVRYVEYMDAYLNQNATRQNLTPVTWAIAMRPELWYELTNVWPISYMSTRGLTLQTGLTMALDAGRVRELADEMREGMFLWVNGHKVPVVLDDGIYEYTNTNDANVPAGWFASNLYFVPMTYLGGRPATFMQHKDYRAMQPELTAAKIADYYWTDGGRFQWTTEVQKWCYTISGRVEPRVILKTPQLAGVIQHILYSPEQHFRTPPEGGYPFGGGVSMRDATALYSDWNLPA